MTILKFEKKFLILVLLLQGVHVVHNYCTISTCIPPAVVDVGGRVLCDRDPRQITAYKTSSPSRTEPSQDRDDSHQGKRPPTPCEKTNMCINITFPELRERAITFVNLSVNLKLRTTRLPTCSPDGYVWLIVNSGKPDGVDLHSLTAICRPCIFIGLSKVRNCLTSWQMLVYLLQYIQFQSSKSLKCYCIRGSRRAMGIGVLSRVNFFHFYAVFRNLFSK